MPNVATIIIENLQERPFGAKAQRMANKPQPPAIAQPLRPRRRRMTNFRSRRSACSASIGRQRQAESRREAGSSPSTPSLVERGGAEDSNLPVRFANMSPGSPFRTLNGVDAFDIFPPNVRLQRSARALLLCR